jgi:hypothetical protein
MPIMFQNYIQNVFCALLLVLFCSDLSFCSNSTYGLNPLQIGGRLDSQERLDTESNSLSKNQTHVSSTNRINPPMSKYKKIILFIAGAAFASISGLFIWTEIKNKQLTDENTGLQKTNQMLEKYISNLSIQFADTSTANRFLLTNQNASSTNEKFNFELLSNIIENGIKTRNYKQQQTQALLDTADTQIQQLSSQVNQIATMSASMSLINNNIVAINSQMSPAVNGAAATVLDKMNTIAQTLTSGGDLYLKVTSTNVQSGLSTGTTDSNLNTVVNAINLQMSPSLNGDPATLFDNIMVIKTQIGVGQINGIKTSTDTLGALTTSSDLILTSNGQVITGLATANAGITSANTAIGTANAGITSANTGIGTANAGIIAANAGINAINVQFVTTLTAKPTLFDNLASVSSQIGTGLISSIKTSTDLINVTGGVKDNLTAVYDTLTSTTGYMYVLIHGIKTSTDTLAAMKVSTDLIIATGGIRDNLTAVYLTLTSSTGYVYGLINGIQTSTDLLSAMKMSTDLISVTGGIKDNLQDIHVTLRLPTGDLYGLINDIKKATDTLDVMKISTDAIGGMRDNLTAVHDTLVLPGGYMYGIVNGIKTDTDTLDVIKTSTDSIKTATDTLDVMKASTDAIKTATDTLDVMKISTDAIGGMRDNLTAVHDTLVLPSGYMYGIVNGIKTDTDTLGVIGVSTAMINSANGLNTNINNIVGLVNAATVIIGDVKAQFVHSVNNNPTMFDNLAAINSGIINANTGITSANTGIGTANTGITSANTGIGTANAGITSANTGIGTANTGITSANTAIGTANTGITSANTAIGTANTGITSANTAISSISAQFVRSLTTIPTMFDNLATVNTSLINANTGISSTNAQFMPSLTTTPTMFDNLATTNAQFLTAVNTKPATLFDKIATANSVISVIKTSTDFINTTTFTTSGASVPASATLNNHIVNILTNSQAACTMHAATTCY